MLVDIVTHTPPWVWLLLAALVALGWSQTRSRAVPLARVLMLPLAMLGLALYGLAGGFARSGWLGAALALWAACAALVWGVIGARAVRPGERFDAATQRLHVAGSWLPLGLIVAIFSMKYAVNVALALQPALASRGAFVLAVAALYGVFNGLLAARMYSLWRLAWAIRTCG